MLTYLFRARPGERFAGSAGANRGEVVLDLSALDPEYDGPVAVSAAGRSAVVRPADTGSGATVVLLAWAGDSGTWHRIGYAGRKDGKPWPATKPLTDDLVWSATSESGGADYAAAVIRVAHEPIQVITSGYRGRRNWTVTTVYADGRVATESHADWRARHSEGVRL